METMINPGQSPEELMSLIKTEDMKAYPNHAVIEKAVEELVKTVHPADYLAEYDIAQALDILVGSYLRINQFEKARKCFKVLYDLVKKASPENGPQVVWLFQRFVDLDDYQGLFRYCVDVLPITEAYYAQKIAETQGITIPTTHVNGKPTKHRALADIHRADLEIFRDRIARYKQRAEEAMAPSQQALHRFGHDAGGPESGFYRCQI
jgi:hypothetical protein